MNRRAFLTGLAAAAVAPAIPAVAGPAGKFYFEITVNDTASLELEMARRVAEYWTRKVQAAFFVQCDYLR